MRAAYLLGLLGGARPLTIMRIEVNGSSYNVRLKIDATPSDYWTLSTRVWFRRVYGRGPSMCKAMKQLKKAIAERQKNPLSPSRSAVPEKAK